MRRIKNWKLFTESVEDSLEEIKWVLVDYDVDDYEYYPNSTKLLSFLVKDKLAVSNELKRIENQAAYEGWNVIYNNALIFYKDDLEDALINWLDENFSNLTVETIVVNNKLHLYYMKNNMRVFTYEKDDDPIDIEVNGILYDIPQFCLKDGNKTSDLLKKWLKDKYRLNIRNIYFED